MVFMPVVQRSSGYVIRIQSKLDDHYGNKNLASLDP